MRKQGTGKIDKRLPGYIRELIGESQARRLVPCDPCGRRAGSLDIAAGASVGYPDESQTNRWFDLPVPRDCNSASARPRSTLMSVADCGLNSSAIGVSPPSRPRPCNTARRSTACSKPTSIPFALGRAKTDEELIDLFRHDLAGRQDSGNLPARTLREAGSRAIAGIPLLRSLGRLRCRSCIRKSRLRFIWGRRASSAGSIASTSRPDGSVAIVDYKTGKARDQEDADESLQLSLYAIAAREKWGYEVGALIFHNLEENVPVVTVRTRCGIARCARSRVAGCRPGDCRRASSKPEVGYSLQFLRVSKPLSGEGKTHPTAR